MPAVQQEGQDSRWFAKSTVTQKEGIHKRVICDVIPSQQTNGLAESMTCLFPLLLHLLICAEDLAERQSEMQPRRCVY